MNLTPKKTPSIIKKMFPDYVWNINTTQKELFLTFDDGPTPGVTDWVLDTLKRFNAQATFFCIGDNIKKHPELFKRIIKEGHAVGNHTNNHLKGWNSTTELYVNNVDKAQQIMKIQAPELKSEKLFRPPYGKLKHRQGEALIKLGYKIVMWDVLSVDWDKSILQETCFKNVVHNAKEGSIIVFHDSVKAEKNLKYALPKALDYFTKKNFVFKAIN